MDTRPAALAVVAAGGAVGAVARWAITATWPTAVGGAGWGTLTVNLTGCFLLGVLAARSEPDTLLRLGLGTGVLGGFTTFSTLVVETDRGLAEGRTGVAVALLAISLLGGVGLAVVGERGGAPVTVVAFVVAAAFGAVLRHLVTTAARDVRRGILVANVVGSFLLGLLVGGDAGRTVVVVLGTGFCGALTTWSSFAHGLADDDDGGRAVVHAVTSIALGLAAAALGLAVA